MALGDVLKAYGEEAFARVLPELGKMLALAKDQPSDSTLFGDLSNETAFGVAKRRRDNDPKVHTGQVRGERGSTVSTLLLTRHVCRSHFMGLQASFRSLEQ